MIGGGPSGLALAYGLQGDTLVLEKDEAVGGLCRSIQHDGGVFDIGGHSFHTPYPEAHDLVQKLRGDRLYGQQRDARVYTHGMLIPYPFQESFDQIKDPQVVRDCEEGLRNKAGDPSEASNFEDFIIRRFGQGIAEHFMLPYNRKLWACDLREISTEWTSQRVASPKGKVERFETSGGERKPLQSDTKVGYPKDGGYEEICKAFVSHVPGVGLNANVVRIDPTGKTAVTASGDGFGWQFLVSTMPLPTLVRTVAGIPDEMIEMADQLRYLSLRIEYLLTRRPLETPIQRVYVADPDIPPHKIALNHNSSDSLRARHHHAIVAEVSYSDQKPLETEQVGKKTIELLCDLGILDSPDDIIWQGRQHAKYGYPVYTHDRPALVDGIRQWLESHDIYTLGRFGDWEYINSDACIMKGLDLARELRQRYLEQRC